MLESIVHIIFYFLFGFVFYGFLFHKSTEEEQKLIDKEEAIRSRRLKSHKERQYRKAKANRKNAFIKKWG